MTGVSLRGAGVRYGDLWAVRGIDLDVEEGERLAIAGPSGAGKTTLLSLINGTVHPTEGIVRVLGRDLSRLGARELRAVQGAVGTVYQQFDLVGPLRVVHNVNAGRLASWSLARAAWSLLRPAGAGDVEAALRRVGIPEKLYERTDRLSGGQQQRVAIARVLVQDPAIILADEPVASLDPGLAREVMDLLRDLAGELGRTLIVSLHAFEFALSHCERVVGLREGRVTFDAPSREVTPELAGELYRVEEAGAPR